MIPRHDELAMQSEIDLENQFKNKLKNIGSTLTASGTAIAGMPFLPKAIEKLSPFFSKYIPTELALKGISKLNPKVGDFLKKGMNAGLNIQEGFDFIKEKAESSEEKKEPAKENRNIIEQYSPELHQFIDEQIKNGRKVIEAGAIAQNDKRFSNVINKISKDHKTDWSNILESVYGQGEVQPKSQRNQTQPPQETFYDTQENQQKKELPGSETLMEALKLAAESRKRRQR